jgi:hypothetical protein
VTRREEIQGLVAQLVDAGRAAREELDQAAARVADAKARLAKVRE